MKNVILSLFVVVGFSAFAQTKIGHVDSKKLLDTLPSRKIAINKLDSMQTSGMQELQLLDAEFQKQYQAYIQDQVNKSPAERQIIEGRLMQKQLS